MAASTRSSDLPRFQGLYDPSAEHDACGVNFVVNMRGKRSHEIVEHGLGALCNLEHRGAVGSDPNAGDGAGDRKSTRLNSSHSQQSRMPSSA